MTISFLGFGATRELTGNGQWSNSGVWLGGNAPTGTNDDVYSNRNGLSTQIPSSSSYTVTGILFNKASSLTLYSNSSLTINGDFIGNSSLSITVQSGATLTVNGKIEASNGLTINVNNGGTLIVEDPAEEGIVSAGDITLTIGGVASITGDVNAGGDVDIDFYNGSTLMVSGGLTAPGSNGTSITGGGDISFGGVIQANNNLDMDIYSGGSFVAGGLSTNNGTAITISGDVRIKGDVTLGRNTDLDVYNGSNMTVTGNVTATGTGSASYNIDGALVVGGNLDVAGATLDVDGGSGTVTTGGTCESNDNDDNIECGVTAPIALPVSLLSFKDQSMVDKIHLNWQTATELNNDYFTLEKSYDGIHFYHLAKIQGAGSTNELRSYSYEDLKSGNVVYYRLSQTDYDGTTELLDALRVGGQYLPFHLTLYPNPLVDTKVLTVEGVTGDMTWQLLDSSGRIVDFGDFLNGNKLDFSKLPKGLHLIRIDDGKSIFTDRIMIK